MFKKSFCWVCVVFLFGITTFTYGADPNSEIPKINVSPVIDGKMDSIWSSVYEHKMTHYVSGATTPADCSASWRAYWDGQYLYVFVDVNDDALRSNPTDTAGNQYQYDSVEIFTDIHNDNATTWVSGADDYQYRFSYDSVNPLITVDHAWNSTNGIEYKFLTTVTGYNLELKIPWSTMYFGGETPSIGDLMGFEVQINDNDNGSTRETQLSWYATANNVYNNPSNMGTVTLVAGSVDRATGPYPPDNAADVERNVILNWKPGFYANSHNLFFGTNFNDVNNATLAASLGTEVAQALPLDSNSYDPIMTLEFSKTYYWRVDEVNAPENPGTIKGQVWQFDAESYSLKLSSENIKATANDGDPTKTIDESGLDADNPNQHNSSGASMWATNGNDPNGTWIQYDFDKLYKLDQMYVWNYNAAFNNKYGIQDVLIQYSDDNGQTWTDITSVTQFAKAPAKSGYVYNTVVPFDGAIANSVRITELSNFVSGSGTGSKAGLSEVRFYYIPLRARKPSPASGSTDISVTETTLKWRTGRDAATHRVYIDTNENAVINSTSTAHTVTDSSYMPSSLNLGRTYYWCVNEINTNETPSVWQSDIWDFSTEEYLTIDDFEDYNDNQFQGYAIFNTWGDGYDMPTTNGGRVGYQDKTPFCETVIVEHGNQSAPIIYDNTGSIVNSEVYRNYSTPQNWSAYGADTLRLYYRGKAVTFQQTSDGLIAMSAEGSDIYGASDQFRFAYKTLSGDGYIIARVDTIERVNDWSKAGIMIRNSLDPNAIHVTAVLGANGTAEMESRTTKGGTTTTTDVTGQGNPCWLKLTRAGNVITVQRSKDGVNWYSFGTDPNVASTVTVSMSNQVYIGLVVTSHTADTLAAATFSNVSMSSKITGTWTVAAIGDTNQAEGGNTLDSLYVSLTDNANHSKKVFAPSDALGTGSWVQWDIPLSQFSGVTLSQIKKLAIGAGDSSAPLKGKGTFYIDNIGFGHTLEE